MRITKVVLTLTIILSFMEVQANVTHVYRIDSTCQKEPYNRVLTGFSLEDYEGVITALHGVADNCKISIGSKSAKLVYADIKHDIALLSVSGISKVGFEKGDTTELCPGCEVSALGYPYGIDIVDITLKVRKNHPIRPLKELLESYQLSYYGKRGSPSIDQAVLSLQGPLTPSTSGSPIVTNQGKVVAVANGGLKSGTVGICWAIPIDSIVLKPWKQNKWNSDSIPKLDYGLFFGATQGKYSRPKDEIFFAAFPQPFVAGRKFVYAAVNATIGPPASKLRGRFYGPPINNEAPTSAPMYQSGFGGTMLPQQQVVVSMKGMKTNPWFIFDMSGNTETVPEIIPKNINPKLIDAFGVAMFYDPSTKENDLISIFGLSFDDSYAGEILRDLLIDDVAGKDNTSTWSKGGIVIGVMYEDGVPCNSIENIEKYISKVLKVKKLDGGK